MIIDKEILDELTLGAKASSRLRLAYDLRNTPEELSQRMLNAIEPGTVVPIHRHLMSNETVLCVRGHFEELLYNDEGKLIQIVDMLPGGNIVNVPIGMWHSLRSLESGTIVFEAKDGKYEPLEPNDIFTRVRAKRNIFR